MIRFLLKSMENDIGKNGNRLQVLQSGTWNSFLSHLKYFLAGYSEHLNFVQKIRVTTFVIQSLLKTNSILFTSS